jgi:hypothetical protein
MKPVHAAYIALHEELHKEGYVRLVHLKHPLPRPPVCRGLVGARLQVLYEFLDEIGLADADSHEGLVCGRVPVHGLVLHYLHGVDDTVAARTAAYSHL